MLLYYDWSVPHMRAILTTYDWCVTFQNSLEIWKAWILTTTSLLSLEVYQGGGEGVGVKWSQDQAKVYSVVTLKRTSVWKFVRLYTICRRVCVCHWWHCLLAFHLQHNLCGGVFAQRWAEWRGASALSVWPPPRLHQPVNHCESTTRKCKRSQF